MSIDSKLGIEIIDGAWPIGHARSLEEIQARFGVSRTVAREVSRQLEAVGLVQARRRLGLVAQPQEVWNMLHPDLIRWRLHSTHRVRQMRSIIELRQAVEPMAAEGAALVAPVRAKALLLSLAAEMRQYSQNHDKEAFISAVNEFHDVLLSACGNELFAALGKLAEVAIRARADFKASAEKRKLYISGHEDVAAAIFRGSPDEARESMRILLTNAYAEFFSEPDPRFNSVEDD